MYIVMSTFYIICLVYKTQGILSKHRVLVSASQPLHQVRYFSAAEYLLPVFSLVCEHAMGSVWKVQVAMMSAVATVFSSCK